MTTQSLSRKPARSRRHSIDAEPPLPQEPSAPAHRVALVERIDAEGRVWLRGPRLAAHLLAGCVPGPGDAVLVAMVPGSPAIVLGLVRDRLPAQATVDGQQLELRAEREITLRCGKSSLTLTSDGRISLQGEAVLSRAQGVNRIIGGSVQIN